MSSWLTEIITGAEYQDQEAEQRESQGKKAWVRFGGQKENESWGPICSEFSQKVSSQCEKSGEISSRLKTHQILSGTEAERRNTCTNH